MILAIGLAFTPQVARTVRSAVMSERHLDYVAAARLRGENALYIMLAEILPNVLPPIMVELTVRLGYAIFTVATLSFLGVGLQPPSPDWGLAISENYALIGGGYWWTVLFDALAIASLVVAINLIADALAWSRRVNAPAQQDALRIEGLDVAYRVRGRDRQVLRNLNLAHRPRRDLRPRRGIGLRQVHRGPCGRCAICRATAASRAGRILVDGQDLYGLPRAELRKLRSSRLSMVYQDPGRALNPAIVIGRQLAEVFEIAGLRAKRTRRSGPSPCCATCRSPIPSG